MSAYEQRIEPPDRRWQYLLMAAEPYETIAFKVGSDPRLSGFPSLAQPGCYAEGPPPMPPAGTQPGDRQGRGQVLDSLEPRDQAGWWGQGEGW